MLFAFGSAATVYGIYYALNSYAFISRAVGILETAGQIEPASLPYELQYTSDVPLVLNHQYLVEAANSTHHALVVASNTTDNMLEFLEADIFSPDIWYDHAPLIKLHGHDQLRSELGIGKAILVEAPPGRFLELCNQFARLQGQVHGAVNDAVEQLTVEAFWKWLLPRKENEERRPVNGVACRLFRDVIDELDAVSLDLIVWYERIRAGLHNSRRVNYTSEAFFFEAIYPLEILGDWSLYDLATLDKYDLPSDAKILHDITLPDTSLKKILKDYRKHARRLHDSYITALQQVIHISDRLQSLRWFSTVQIAHFQCESYTKHKRYWDDTITSFRESRGVGVQDIWDRKIENPRAAPLFLEVMMKAFLGSDIDFSV